MFDKIPKKIYLIFALAFILRILFLSKGALTFGYDQARDGFIARQIVGGDLKILGPPASTPGLFHGVFYYYFLAIPYFFGKNPLLAAYWTALFNSMVVFIVYLLVKLMSKSGTAATISAVLFAVSFEATQYAVWLSNPTLGVWTVPLIYLGLWLWLKEKGKKCWGAALAGLALGLSTQAEIFLLYHVVPVLIWLWIGRKQVKFRQLLYFASSFVLATFTMILVEFKFGFKGLGGLANLASTQDAIVQQKNLGDFIVLFLNQIGKVFANNLLPINPGYGGILGILILVYALTKWFKSNMKGISWQPFLATYVLAHLSVVSVGGTSTPFLLVGIGTGVACLAGLVINDVSKTSKNLAVALFSLIVVANLITILKQNPHGQTIFSIQHEFTLKNQLSALDYTYEKADSKPFSINTVTSPLWINNVWSYLYDWYGKEKYGYVPQWQGKDQVGQLSENVLPFTNTPDEISFLIVEPLQGIPGLYYQETIDQENSRTTLEEEKHFNEITVQYRLLKPEYENK